METTSIEIIAKRFLRTGTSSPAPEKELALACQELIQTEARRSLKSARALAERFVDKSQGGGRFLRLTAYRALARMTHMCGDHENALRAYLEARKLARSDAVVRARIDRALIDVYMYLGDYTKARNSAQKSIKTFLALKADSDLAQTRVNYANLLHRQDRHIEAEKLYRDAAEFFEHIGNRLAVARCYYNRANTLVQLFKMEEAEKLYEQSWQIYDSEGYVLDACDARYGLAWLRMLTGDFHRALPKLSACEKTYREGGDPRGEALCALDRAEVYLGLGLYPDAYQAAHTAEKKFSKLKLRYESSKAALFRGQAAFGLGLKRRANTAMTRAREGFTAEKNDGFLGAVYLLAADLAGKDQNERFQRIKEARNFFSRAQLPLWEAVCDLRQAADPARTQAALKRLSQNRAAKQVPHLFTLWQTARGDYEFRRGRPAVARRYWHRAVDRLDTIRALLPPPELRSAYGHKHSMPHLRLIASEMKHDPVTAAVWSERYKTAGLWSPISALDSNDPRRRNVEESLNALARQVAALAHRISGQSGERALSGPAADKALKRLQDRVREELMVHEGGKNHPLRSTEKILDNIKEVSHRLPVVQFHLDARDIYAFVHRTGKTTLRHFHGGRRRLDEAMGRWRFILEGELLSKYLRKPAEPDNERMFWEELGEWLWAPLGIDRECPRVLILPEGGLSNLPWQALIVDGTSLLERHQFIICPSLRHFLYAEKVSTRSDDVHLFRGIADDLPQTDCELNVLSDRAGDKAITYRPCRREDWPTDGEARLWHFTGHAVLRSDNPFYSYLLVDDGPLFAADFRLKNCRVGLVTLAACRSAEEVALPGEESTGLVRSLLEMGARNIIASHWPVSDESTALWMGAFYNRFFDNENILNSARHASNVVREKFSSAYHWAAFSVSGAGDMGGQYEE